MRTRRAIGLAALLVTLSLACGFLAAAGNNWYQGKDFHCFWVAGRIVAHGNDPYEAAVFRPAVLVVPPTPARALERCGQRLSYPPWTGMAMAPFGALPLPAAATLWVSLVVLAAVLGVNWTWQLAGSGRIPWPLVAVLVIFNEPFFRTLTEGQFATFSLALTAGAALSLQSDRAVAGGIATAGLALKPHTAIGSTAALVGLALLRGRWRFLGVAAAAGLALAGVTQLIRPGWLVEFAGAATALSASIADRATIWNLTGSWPLAVGIIALLVVLVLILIRRRHPDDADLIGLAVAFGLVITPYAWSHDFVVLAIPWSMTIARANGLRASLRRFLTFSTVIVAAPLLWLVKFIPIRQFDSLPVLAAMITTVLLAVAIHWARSDVDT